MSAWWEGQAIRHSARQAPGPWTCRCWKCAAARKAAWLPPSHDVLGRAAYRVRVAAEAAAPAFGADPKTLARMCSVTSLTLVLVMRELGHEADLVAGIFADVAERHFWSLVATMPGTWRGRRWMDRAALVDLTATQFEAVVPGVPRLARLEAGDEIRGLYRVEARGLRAEARMTPSDRAIAERIQENLRAKGALSA